MKELADAKSLRDRVVLASMLIWGDRWPAPLSKALSAARGKKVGTSQICHWRSGLRPPPVWVDEAMADMVSALPPQSQDVSRELKRLFPPRKETVGARSAQG